MKEEIPYKILPKYVLRSPLFSLSNFMQFTSKRIVSDKDFKALAKNPVFEEALFLASPSLYMEMRKWLNNNGNDKKASDKIKFSILKYFSRMSSRCTPFGLFAGCSIGEFGETTNIELKGEKNNGRHTRLDMNYLVALSQDLIKNKNIRNRLLFYPNSSIYRTGNKLRYVEYYYKNSKRYHNIMAVDYSEYLEKIFDRALKGASLTNLALIIVDDEITMGDAMTFIEELVSSQLLISELEPSVSGPEFLEQIMAILKRMESAEEILKILEDSAKRIAKIDRTIGNNTKEYIELSKSLKRLKTDFDLKFMFQTDMVLRNSKNTLDKSLQNDLIKGLKFLNRITLPPQSNYLTQFKEAFYERYEEREVSLSNAMDIEIGIGYKQAQDFGDVNPLVDNIVVPEKVVRHSHRDIKWTSINTFFEKKLKEAYRKNSYTIELKDNDFQDLDESWDDLPDTMSSIIEVVKIDRKIKIKFNGGGGSSAANLLGRFCHGDDELLSFTREIVDIESQMSKDKILAEIVHLPESRVGNILMRPDFRKFEIPYLARSIKPFENQLTLDDIMISIKNHKRIFLKSKKWNKEILPHLTNAHSYSNNSLPIYHFLCDMQTQNLRSGVGFNYGPFANEHEFLPRVEYNNLILHDATWNLNKDHFKELMEYMSDDNRLWKSLKVLRKKLQLPQYVLFTDRDNKLLINLKNLTSVRMLLNIIKKRPNFVLTEFLFTEEGIVKNGDLSYTNQIIVSFYNSNKVK